MTGCGPYGMFAFGFIGNTSGGSGGGGPIFYYEVTKAQADALISNSGLTKGSFYKIMDRGDLGIMLQATSANTFSLQGVRYMLCPSNYTPGAVIGAKTSVGIFNSEVTPAAGNIAIWGGLVWLNNTGALGNASNQATLDGPDWTVISKASFADGEYTPMQFMCIYDYANDWIEKQWDTKGNEVGVSYQAATDGNELQFIGGNPCDMTDWNLSTMTSVVTNFAIFYGNQCKGIFNNSTRGTNTPVLYIYNNIVNGFIYNNSGDISLDIDGNMNGGSIYSNFLSGFREIRLNGANTGGIHGNQASQINSNNNAGEINDNIIAFGLGLLNYNSNAGHITTNGNNGNITYNSNAGQISTNSNSGDIRSNNNNGEIINNSNSGIISLNSNNGTITGNTNQDAISQNANQGSISTNANTGVVSNNSNYGDISNNTSSVALISFNSNLGIITENDNGGDIAFNSNAGPIFSNSGGFSITLNSNDGEISGNSTAAIGIFIKNNSNSGTIQNNTIDSGAAAGIDTNSNSGTIFGNLCGDIVKNKNNGGISGNAVTITNITSNVNNGSIIDNGGDPTPVAIEFNTNNGLISNAAWAADVTDPVVDKT